jgi:flavin-dependent dehydrogenase
VPPANAQVSVAVIGAGPAGCAAARLLSSWGHDVALVGRRPSPDRSLGESIPPSCIALLERVGFSSPPSLHSTGNTVRWGSGEERVEYFPEGRVGYQVDRAEFDAFVQKQAGIPIALDESLPEAHWRLDCTGRSGLIARDGWRVREDAARTMAIVGVWESESWPTQDPTHTIVESTEEGWAWSVPTSPTRRYVTLMVDPALTPLAGIEEVYARQLALTRSMQQLVQGARRVGSVFARDASPYSAHTYAQPGTLLVGDAGSFVDPLSSYGIKKALASAWLAAVVVHSCLLSPAITTAALELFNARERAMYDALRRSAAALARDAHATAFWEARAASADMPSDFEPDVSALRQDADVLRSLDELRARDAIALRTTSVVQRASRPTVRGNRVVVEDHLVVPAFPDGVRYVRNIDLVRLSELAPSHRQVPDLFDAYNRAAPPAPLPDFLGALSLLMGKGFLEWS